MNIKCITAEIFLLIFQSIELRNTVTNTEYKIINSYLDTILIYGYFYDRMQNIYKSKVLRAYIEAYSKWKRIARAEANIVMDKIIYFERFEPQTGFIISNL